MRYATPGVYVEELQSGSRPIMAVGTSTAGFVGRAPLDEHVNVPRVITNWSRFKDEYCGDSKDSTDLVKGVYGFFQNGGRRCFVVNQGPRGDIEDALHALARIDEIAIVAAPGQSDSRTHSALVRHCEELDDRFAILDPPERVSDLRSLILAATESGAAAGDEVPEGGVRPAIDDKGRAAFYYPWLRTREPLDRQNPTLSPPSGFMAGIYARVDGSRGVHKAPANEPVTAAEGLAYYVTPIEQEELNTNGVNVIRFFSNRGILVWGARTIASESSEFRYISVRRLFNMIKESIQEAMAWVVFEPNDPSLWSSITRDVSNFLLGLWRNGALMGASPEEAFYVKCDRETNPDDVINRGQVITEIGIAPVKPAEFIIFRIGQSEIGEASEGGDEGAEE